MSKAIIASNKSDIKLVKKGQYKGAFELLKDELITATRNSREIERSASIDQR